MHVATCQPYCVRQYKHIIFNKEPHKYQSTFLQLRKQKVEIL